MILTIHIVLIILGIFPIFKHEPYNLYIPYIQFILFILFSKPALPYQKRGIHSGFLKVPVHGRRGGAKLAIKKRSFCRTQRCAAQLPLLLQIIGYQGSASNCARHKPSSERFLREKPDATIRWDSAM